jgi:class I fructose-bisphosphate aldolase
MDARTGKRIRLGRLFDQQTGKSLIVAYSHAVLMGPQPGMRTMAEVRRVVHQVHNADGLLVTPGMLTQVEDAFVGKDRPALVIHLDYQSFSRPVLPYSVGATTLLANIEDVVAAGADAVMTYLYIGYDDPEREKAEIQRNAMVARACERWGVGLMIEPRSARENTHREDDANAALLALYCRIAAEIGGDIIKCVHPGSTEALADVVASCPVPLLVAGGPKEADVEVAYQRARSAIDAGAAGLVFGRNVFSADDPAAELTRFRQIVHGQLAVA